MIGISPFNRPDTGLVAALCDAGALGVLDLGRDRAAAVHALAVLKRRLPGGFGVRIPAGVDFAADDLPAQVDVVIVGAVADVARYQPRAVIVQVTSLDEARAAVAAGADGIIAKGSEAGGRVGEETAFVLLQQLVAAIELPVWVQGGIGMHTAAACIAGGAAGIVLDSQLALVRESSLGAEIRGAIGAMDGSETVVIGGYRVYTRPDLPVAGMAGATTEEVRARLGGDDLAACLLAVGQEGAFARAFAQRFATAGGVVRGLGEELARHLESASAEPPLAPGAALAAAHGMRYPIAQGPMSRVSDRARFAAAVAEAGGLPFLALTLMSGDEVRELLRETAALIGDRTWGVGILGFVPQEIRDAQLAVLREIPPPVALIAGGRPSQATALDGQGTLTYLHVPSPGLLDLFLRDGARRFVFEGRECGGHVGPRSSFALWELQIERLLAHPAPEELSVLFAGGIHDGRSAAMVAAMAAPLAARGAKVGVLMGTAYLFTDEAVAGGAIQPGFQEAAIACERTVLLETGPGHATRCADTAFAAAFAEEKQRMQAAGVAPQEMWAALEQLNLGRLRIAAKGLRRDGAVIAAVGDDVQRDEGMFMIGQVAALRRSTCTVAELHREVSEGGTAALIAAATRHREQHPVRAAATTTATDVAIIGLAAIFPGAPDTDTFWRNIVGGANAIREVPPERWSVETYYDPTATGAGAGKKTPCKWGGFLDDIPFDPLTYGIPPRSLDAIEPVQLLSLEIARRALADSGYLDREFDRARTSVIFGAEAGTDLSSAYGFRAMYPHYVGDLPAGLDDTLPHLSEDSFPGVLANVIAGRIANRLDLGGVNYTVDAACAASLAAVDLAVKELAQGSSDMVLCGGADLHNSINDFLLFASVHALSTTGQCHTFDADADGIVLGEGVACVVLKRLADAERDGDRIYAVIKGVAGGSDGKSLGLTAPRKDGQVRALERAYGRAGLSPTQVGLVEAHGTGTVVGDRTELATLTEVYTRAGAAAGTCVLGSVKSQIGHTKCAAGMAGLIKATLAVHHRVLPPTLNIKKPNPYWDADSSPFVFLDESRAWPAEERVAAVSAFGFGGTNFHVLLASHRGGEQRAIGTSWPAELFLFRGDDAAAAVATVDRVRHRLDARLPSEPAPRLRDLARSVCAAGNGPVQIALVADDLDDLRGKLDAARERRADRRGVYVASGDAPGAVAFLCPGQGSQRTGMLAELFIAFPRLQRLLGLGEPWARRMFPPRAFTAEQRAAQAAALTDTRVAQPALGIADLAVAELLQSLGVRPDMAAGHSYGELAALCIAGAFDEPALLALSEARGECILAAAGADPGAMAAVAGAAPAVAAIAAECDGVVIANHNSPVQTVLSGPTAAIEAALPKLAAAGLTARRIPVACAFHSPVVAAASETLGARLAAMSVTAPRIPVWANATAERYPDDADGVRALLAAQVAKPVRFAQEIEAMYGAGARIFVETGPGQVLTNLVGAILGDRPHVAVACDHGGEGGLRQLLRALGVLATSGVGFDPNALFAERDAEIIDLDPDRQAAGGPARASVGWLVNGHCARPAGAPLVAVTPIGAVAVAAAAPVVSDRDAVVLEYLRGARELIAAQRDVMLSYLGTAPVARAPIEVVTAVAHAPAKVLAAAPVAAAPVAVDPMQLVLSIVSERTGYPIETLGPDLDLEADLSIDSIKRIEIVGELAARLGLQVGDSGNRDALVEELATRKTLRSMVTWLESKMGDTGPAKAPERAPVAAPTPPPLRRFVPSTVEAPLPINGYHSLAGKRFTIHADVLGIAPRLAALLTADGAVVRIADGDGPCDADALVHLGGIDVPSDPIAATRALFEQVREAVIGGVGAVLVATGRGGHGGAAGLVKTVAAEWPSVKARVVRLDLEEDPDELAARLRSELLADDAVVEIAYPGGVRSTIKVVPAERGGGGTELALGRDSVVLLTGGARGITARVAVAMARRFGCTIELVGRSPLPARDEDPAYAAAADEAALRRLIAERDGVREPAAIAAAASRLLADREIRATLAAIRDAGAAVTYHEADVRGAAFAALIDDIYARHGRIDGVVHGAGVLEDKLIRHKTAASFERVYATKVAGALTLAEKLRADVGFVVLFGSISGAFGNRGQVDYAAANDALDKLAWALDRRIAGRVVALDWGPWAGTGMVSPELEREYARRGIVLIDPDVGVEGLLAELEHGAPGDAQVILMSGELHG